MDVGLFFVIVVVLVSLLPLVQTKRLDEINREQVSTNESDLTQRDKQAALRWALSKGYLQPEKPLPAWVGIFGVTGLLLGFIPGLVIFGAMLWRSNKSKRQEG